MKTDEKKKHRRARGSGSVYERRGVLWIAYRTADGMRHTESTGSTKKGVAEDLLRKRVGGREHNLPVIKYAERLTFDQAAQTMIDDFTANGKASIDVVQRRITKHLTPVFTGRRMAGITTSDVIAFVAKRQKDAIVVRKARVITVDGVKQEVAAVTKPVSNGEINRELQILKRIFNLAIDSGKIASRPKIKMLREAPARSGFFEWEQYESVLAHLPVEIQPVITMAYITGWRIHDEILPLTWRQVDFEAGTGNGEIRLDPGTTKNREGRVFPMTRDLRTMLKAQHVEHETLKKAGHICPSVFFRMKAEVRGGKKKPVPIVAFDKAWKIACRAAGCPGKIPHDCRRTAIRNFVRSGISEHVAMKLSGHKTRSVFDRYDIVSGDDLRQAAQRLDAVAVGRSLSQAL